MLGRRDGRNSHQILQGGDIFFVNIHDHVLARKIEAAFAEKARVKGRGIEYIAGAPMAPSICIRTACDLFHTRFILPAVTPQFGSASHIWEDFEEEFTKRIAPKKTLIP